MHRRERMRVSDRPGIENALIVVARQPVPGETKTRLSSGLSPTTPVRAPEEAAALYECFLLDTLDLIRHVPDVQRVIAYWPPVGRQYFATLAPDFEYIPQSGSNLGARLDNALTAYLRRGYRRAVIMNSDGPTLPLACLLRAFVYLEDVDVVLGPADDGGYYLIGLKTPAPRLLREVHMSTSHVTRDTLVLATQEDLKVALLPPWYDVDDAESLVRLAAELIDAPDGVAPHTRAFLGAKGIERRIFVNHTRTASPNGASA
jgi:uncharacterized protein